MPVPEIAVAYSFDNEMAVQYGGRQYHQTSRENIVAVQKVFYDLNMDFNTIGLKNKKHNYKLLILPSYVMMSKEEADAVRKYILCFLLPAAASPPFPDLSEAAKRLCSTSLPNGRTRI